MLSIKHIIVLCICLKPTVSFTQNETLKTLDQDKGGTTLAQPFTIGIFGAKAMHEQMDGCEVPMVNPVDDLGQFTSTLNISRIDGFNAWQVYVQEWWTKKEFEGMVQLGKANNMPLLLSYHQYYQPLVNTNNEYLGIGINNYDGCGYVYEECEAPAYTGRQRLNVDSWLDVICNNKKLQDGFLGIQITEEAAFCHYYHSNPDCYGTDGWGELTPTPYDDELCDTPNHRGDASGSYHYTKLPVQNVSEAQEHYKDLLFNCGLYDKKISIMEAHHHYAISECSFNFEGGRPQDYIELLKKEDNRDLFLEGSYFSFPQNWASHSFANATTSCSPCPDNTHYLGFLKSIDYAISKSGETHKVIDVTNNNGDLHTFHSRLSQPNANWLWFQAYASIIHGARGLWFYSHPWMFQESENDKYENWHNPSASTDPFARSGFPVNYNLWVAPLARELSHLSSQGFLDDQSRMFSNTDVGDTYSIINDYKFAWIGQTQNGAIQTFISDFPANWIDNDTDRPFAPYGIRYSFHTNGDEVIMIAANPTNSPVQVIFDFDCVGDRRISESTEFDILFAETNGATVSWSTYKNNRNSIDVDNGQIIQKISRSLDSEGELSISFGALDVVVLRFNKKTSDLEQDNSWNKIWTNYGDNKLGGWNLKETDKLFSGDFNGNGKPDVLAVGDESLSTAWYTLLEFSDGAWTWLWSNYGQSCLLNPYHDNWIVGDFNGDGKDELLGNDTWTTVFGWNGSEWTWLGSDNGSASHPIRPFKDKIISGDFNGDGRDELLCSDLPNGWTTIFEFDGTQIHWGYWTDNGSTSIIKPYRDNGVVGDFDGDGKDEFLGFDTWATLFSFDNGSWSWLWSTNGLSSFAGWNYPLNPDWDRIVVGNFDEDSKDELMLISTGIYASWAMTFDFNISSMTWMNNWVANNTYAIPYINDWPINDGSGFSTKYIALHNDSYLGDYLLASRIFSCSFIEKHQASIYGPDGTNKAIANDDSVIPARSGSEDISLYPNPMCGMQTINILSSKAFDRLEVIDGLGKKRCEILMNGLSYSWTGSFSNLNPGAYAVRFHSSNRVLGTVRLVVIAP